MCKQREAWPDRVKMIACVLVTLGHFFQGVIIAGILPETALSGWFDDTIYYFHVPLFFICSGYLYQKTAKVTSFVSWKGNILKKTVILGIPYVVFSVITWVLKNAFSGSVNIQNQGLIQTLLLSPASPYWYLYALFFVFAITPTCRNVKWTKGMLCAAAAMKLISAFLPDSSVFALNTVLYNEVWFVLGMSMCVLDLPRKLRSGAWRITGFVTATVFVALSIALCFADGDFAFAPLFMGAIGCAAVILITLNWQQSERLCAIEKILVHNTMPIFLMHTIFAAGIRTVLMKLGVESIAVHIVLGMAFSFAGPVVAASIMRRLKLDFLYDPGKYIKFSTKEENYYG